MHAVYRAEMDNYQTPRSPARTPTYPPPVADGQNMRAVEAARQSQMSAPGPRLEDLPYEIVLYA